MSLIGSSLNCSVSEPSIGTSDGSTRREARMAAVLDLLLKNAIIEHLSVGRNLPGCGLASP